MAAAITSSGIGSGLDVTGLVSKLMAAEDTALTPLTQAASSYNAQLSAYGNVKSLVSSFQSTLASLTTASFSAQKSAIINSGTGTALSTDAFTADVNTIDTTSAKAQVIQSVGISPSTTFNSGDSIAIKVGSNLPIFVALNGNATLSGVSDQINAAKTGVTASITSDSLGNHLVLTANSTGIANTIRVSANNSLSQFAYDPTSGATTTMTQTQAALDPIAASSGSYAISVSALAQAEKLKSASFSNTQAFANGVLAIQVGTGNTTLITPASPTLSGIRDAINASSAGVNATIVNNGSTSNLVLTANNTGAVNAITVTGTRDFGPLSTGTWNKETTNPDNSVTNTQTASTMQVVLAAQDAQLMVDNVSVSNPTNSITTAISGVTLNVAKVTTSTDMYNLAISNDSTGVQNNINNFIQSYNNLSSSLTAMTAYNADTKAAGALQGDSAVNSIVEQLRNALISPVSSAGTLQTLNGIGITLQKDGSLALDSTKLTSATTSSFSDIQKLFTSTDGVITRLTALTTEMLGDDGVVTTRTKGLKTSLQINADRQTALQARLDRLQASYTTQFNALDLTLSKLQNTASFLTTQLAAIAKSST